MSMVNISVIFISWQDTHHPDSKSYKYLGH